MAHPADEPEPPSERPRTASTPVANAPVAASDEPPTPSAAVSHAAWMPGLDGLRAIAVIAVMLFHAGLGLAPGGFLGVDVFFVISGYLITTLLLREHDSTGRIDVAGFWRRRMRRLLPALLLLLVSVVAFSALAVPDALGRLRSDVVAAIGYVMNWYLIVDQQSYFEAIGRPSLLRHLWSLAVEEQFYLLWPIALAVGLAVLRRRLTFVLTIAGAAASVIWTAVLLDPDGDPSRVYYGTDTRLFGLLTGAGLAFAWGSRAGIAARFHRLTTLGRLPWADAVAVAGLVALSWAFLTVDQYDLTLYPWGAVAIALVAGLVILAAVAPSGRVGPRLLDVTPLRWVGRRSYGIYLWHWPVFVLTRPVVDVPLSPAADAVLRFGATFALAALSYHFVEEPIRRGSLAAVAPRVRSAMRAGAWSRGAAMASVASVVIAVAVVSGRVLAAPPVPARAGVSTPVLQGAVGSGSGPTSAPALVAGAEPNTPADASAAAEPSFGADAEETAQAGSTGADPTLDAGVDTAASDLQAFDGIDFSMIASGPGDASSGPRSPAETDDPGAADEPVAPNDPAATPDATADQTSPPVARPALQPLATSAAPTRRPAPRPTATAPPSNAKVFAIGDSVLMGAGAALGRTLGSVEVDASIGRQMNAALRILGERQSAERLPDVVIVHVGNNGPVTVRQVNRLLDLLSDVPHVVVMTLRVSRDWQDHNNRLIRDLAPRRGNVILVDWFAATDGRSDLFWKDGEHVRPEGARFYANLVARALRDHGVSTR